MQVDTVSKESLLTTLAQMQSLYNAMFPLDPKMWVTDVAPIGALRAWLVADKKTPLPSYLTPMVIDLGRPSVGMTV